MRTFVPNLLLFSALISGGGFAQSQPSKHLLEKAKKEGVTAAELPFFLKREQARLGGNAVKETLYQGSYSQLYSLQNTILSKTNASGCNNIDFEDHNYNGWNIFKGYNSNSLMAPDSVVPYTTPSLIGYNLSTPFTPFDSEDTLHAIVDSAHSVYYNTSTPGVYNAFVSNYPGKTIARINHVGVGYKVGILERPIAITSSNPFINFSFCAFLANAGHTQVDQPYFAVKIVDQNNNPIPGTAMKVVADSAAPNPGFLLIQTYQGGNGYFYKPWTPVSFDMSAYIGQAVTIQFIAADCGMGGHGGFAYVDFDCGATPSGGALTTWPGDANYDLNVDLLDFFYLGAAYGYTGTARSVQGNTWASLLSPNWNQSGLYLVNAKHADCDGDGVVSASDTTAISQNYGLGHAFKGVGQMQLTAAAATGIKKSLTIKAPEQFINAGTPFQLDFELDNHTTQGDSIYALGFSLTYPDYLLDNSKTRVDCNGSSMGANTLGFQKPLSGRIDVAVSKTDQRNSKPANGGTVFSLKMLSAVTIPAETLVDIEVSNIIAIDRSGKKIPFDSIVAPLQLDFLEGSTVNVKTLAGSNSSVLVFPNPAKDQLVIKTSDAKKIKGYRIVSVLGTVVKESNSVEQGTIDISELKESAYVLQLKMDDGSLLSKSFIKN